MFWQVVKNTESESSILETVGKHLYHHTQSTTLTSGDSGSLVLVVLDLFILLCKKEHEFLLPPHQLSIGRQ